MGRGRARLIGVSVSTDISSSPDHGVFDRDERGNRVRGVLFLLALRKCPWEYCRQEFPLPTIGCLPARVLPTFRPHLRNVLTLALLRLSLMICYLGNSFETPQGQKSLGERKIDWAYL